MKKRILLIIIASFSLIFLNAAQILVPMDLAQKDHLKAYGMTYWVLQKDIEAHWLLNYRGGSFMFRSAKSFTAECSIRGVTYEEIPDAKSTAILEEISNPELNQEKYFC